MKEEFDFESIKSKGIDREGHKELLEMYISRNEGTNFWLIADRPSEPWS